MGWTAYYQLVRRDPLTAKELAELAKVVRYAQKRKWDGEAFGLVVATAPHPSGVVAKGWNKMSTDEGSWDPNLVCEILDKLRKKFPDVAVHVSDDFGILKLGPEGFTKASGAKTPFIQETDDGSWESILSVVPLEQTSPPTVAAALDRHAANALTDADRTDEKLIAAMFKLLVTPEVKTEPIKAVLAVCDADVVARVALAKYGSYQGADATSALAVAFSKVRDVPALADLFVAAWSKPRGTYFYGDMPVRGEVGAAIAAQPVVRDRLLADLHESASGRATRDLELRRAEVAAILLGRSKDARALRYLAEYVRANRTAKLESSIQFRVYLPALEGLSLAADPRWVATTLLALEGTAGTARGEAQAVENSLVADAALATPIVRMLVERELAVVPCLDAIARLGPAGAALSDLVERLLQHPHRSRRATARATMAALRGTERTWLDDSELRDVEAHLLHRDREVRHDALRELHNRKDTSLVVALCIAEQIDAHLRARADQYPGLPFSWWDWKGTIPKKVIEMRSSERLAWARGEGAAALGEQRMPAVIAAVADMPPREVAASYGHLTIRYDDATRARLVALEDQAFAATA